MVSAIGRIEGDSKRQSPLGSARSIIPTRLTSAQIQEIFKEQREFPFRGKVIRCFTPPSDQGLDIQRRILKELNNIFTKNRSVVEGFEHAVSKDFAAYLKDRETPSIGVPAANRWENQLKLAFNSANDALIEAQKSDVNFRAGVVRHFEPTDGSDENQKAVLRTCLGQILEFAKNEILFQEVVKRNFENSLVSLLEQEEDALFLSQDLDTAFRKAVAMMDNRKEVAEEKEASVLAIAYPVSIPSSSVVPQTGPTVVQRIKAFLAEVWNLIASFFANLVRRLQES